MVRLEPPPRLLPPPLLPTDDARRGGLLHELLARPGGRVRHPRPGAGGVEDATESVLLGTQSEQDG